MGVGAFRPRRVAAFAGALPVAMLLVLAAAATGTDAASPQRNPFTAADLTDAGPLASVSVERRCQTVRVVIRRNGKVVRRNGRPVTRPVRRCRIIPSPGCRFVRIKKRKDGRVVTRRGKPVLVRVERCPPKRGASAPRSSAPALAPPPAPPAPPVVVPPLLDLANRALAPPQRTPGDIDIFTSIYANAEQGFYPSGSAMTPAGGAPPTEAAVRASLTAHLERTLGAGSDRIAQALGVFDDPGLKAIVADADPTLRAAVAGMTGTLLEPTIGPLLTGGRFSLIRWGTLPSSGRIAASAGGTTGRVISVNNRYKLERFEYLVAIMGHEILHDDFGNFPNGGPEEAVLNALSGMTHMQVLSGNPGLAHGGTELARQMNDLALLFINSREVGAPDSEIYAPTGLGVAPGSPRDARDLWTFFNGGGVPASPGSAALRAILAGILGPTVVLPAAPTYSQATAELFAGLGDGWLSDVQRAQLSVLLRLITVEEIAQATGLGTSAIVETLGLAPYLAAMS